MRGYPIYNLEPREEKVIAILWLAIFFFVGVGFVSTYAPHPTGPHSPTYVSPCPQGYDFVRDKSGVPIEYKCKQEGM